MNKSLEEPLGDDHSVSLQVLPSESHGHGHSHGDSHGGHGHGGQGGHGGHGHSHGSGDACCSSKPREKLPWYVIRGCSMKSFIYGMIISVWYMVYNYFCEPLTDDFDRKGSKLLITFQVVMAIISYYRCSNISSANPTKDVPVYANPPHNELCKKCAYWKPERTHHCSKCRECVLRMDHHCPWIVNCVGYHNHKSFFLFCFYISTGGMVYTYRSIYYLVCVLKDSSLSADMSYKFIAFWIFQSGLIISFMVMVGGLTYYHWTLAMNNMTTLESMGGRNMRFACESHIALEKKMMNKYDRGFLANLYEFFGHTVFLWWWPTRPNAMYFGQYLRKVTMPSEREAQDFRYGKTNEESAEERALKPRRIEDIDLQNVFKMAQEYAPDTTFQFFDRTFKKEGETTNEVSQGETEKQPELMNS